MKTSQPNAKEILYKHLNSFWGENGDFRTIEECEIDAMNEYGIELLNHAIELNKITIQKIFRELDYQNKNNDDFVDWLKNSRTDLLKSIESYDIK